MSLRVLIAGGGTGGHVFPGLALAEALLAGDEAEQPPVELLFVGSRRGLENELVPAHGYRLEVIDVGTLKGAHWRQRVTTLAGLPVAVGRALRIISAFRPDVVVGLGGYASAPTLLAARLRRCPTLLLEQNSIPGLTNRLLAKGTDRIVISYPDAARHLPPGRSICLGNPLRQSLIAACGQPRPDHEGVNLLILGGSQGAVALNRLVAEAISLLTQDAGMPALSVFHQTGRRDYDRAAAHYREQGISARVEPFVEDMAAAYRQADLVVARSGATTLAEVALAGLPAILVPYPHAADDHQAINAAWFVAAGAAVMLRQEGLTGAALAAEIRKIVLDAQRRLRMAQAMSRCAWPGAGREIARLVRELGQKESHR